MTWSHIKADAMDLLFLQQKQSVGSKIIMKFVYKTLKCTIQSKYI